MFSCARSCKYLQKISASSAAKKVRVFENGFSQTRGGNPEYPFLKATCSDGPLAVNGKGRRTRAETLVMRSQTGDSRQSVEGLYSVEIFD
jgi:hypothetical protein